MWSKAKRQELIELLSSLYPDPSSELRFKNDYQLLISVMLSAQCTDKKVNEVTPLLFKKYQNFKSLGAALESEVAIIIRPINYYRTKAKNIIATASDITLHHDGRLPLNRTDLEELPGVGRKTASVILSEKNVEPAFPVDTHVYRLARRLELAKRENREGVEEELRLAFNPKHWRHLHHQLIFHGRRVCKAQRPLCSECTLSKLCPSSSANEP